jgi:hypothetical protein
VTLASVASILGAFGLGGIVGILLRSAHERNERFRDRMIVATEDFLGRVFVARATLVEVQQDSQPAADGSLTRDAERALTAVRDGVPSIWILFPSTSQGIGLGPGKRAGEMRKKLDGILDDLKSLEVLDSAEDEQPVRQRVAEAFHRLEGQIWDFGQQTQALIWQRRLGRGITERFSRRDRRRKARKEAKRAGGHWDLRYEMVIGPSSMGPHTFDVFRVHPDGSKHKVGNGGNGSVMRQEARAHATAMARADLAERNRLGASSETIPLDVG